jgi:hypothetical protein
MRVAWIAVAGLWCAAASIDAIAGERSAAQLVLAFGSGAIAWGLVRADRAAYLASLGIATLGLVAALVHLSLDRANLAALQRMVYAVAWLAFACFLLLPATRRRFGMRGAGGPEPRAALRWAALAVHALGIAVCAALLWAGALYAVDGLGGIWRPYERRAEAHPQLGAEWAMHPVENTGDLLPNGLDPADVDADGWPDFVTNYELEGRLRVAFHPGTALDRGRAWPALDVGAVTDAESSALGDLDGDGGLDVIAVHGVEAWDVGPGVRVYWGSSGGGRGALRWSDGGDLPASTVGWHFLYTKAVDLDADGDLDVIAGGRASRRAFGRKEGLDDPALAWVGIRWFENPGREAARELPLWRAHAIDAGSRSGHGFELGDVDGDGDLDLANANSDFDTPEDEENVVWYQNPGRGRLTEEWPRHELLRSAEFYAKEQVAIGDLDGDGRNDVLAHAPERIWWFRNLGPEPGSATPRFETLEIPKPEPTRWRARPLELADLDGDGQLDVIGALIHHEGKLPRDKAAMFWMKRGGDGWTTQVIKWADGFRGLNVMNGEKWDQIVPVDVDRDGDLDLVANVEEYNRLRSVLAVVWFENPRIRPPARHER